MTTPSISSTVPTLDNVINTTPAIQPNPHLTENTVVSNATAEPDPAMKENSNVASESPTGSKLASNVTNGLSNREKEFKRLFEIVNVDHRYEQVTRLLHTTIDELIQEGLQGFHMHDSAARNLDLAREELDSKEREIQRLRACEESSRNTIMNLLQSVENEKSSLRDLSRHAQIEARLRSELASLRGERDQALADVSLLKRKAASMEEDLNATKQKLAKSEQEKIKMERDTRAAISLAKSVGSETSSDVDFYKRKSIELQNQMSAQLALLAEQNTQIEEMRRQQERSMSQNRLASMRVEGENGRKSL